MSNVDRQAYGYQELSGKEPRGGGDLGVDIYDLLRQDRHTHTEPHDCGAHVVW